MRSIKHLLLGAVLLPAVSSCQQLDCPGLCERVKRCQTAVARAVAARLPGKSSFMKEARRRLPARFAKRLTRSCAERCGFLRKNKRWRRILRRCLKRTGCEAFARCVAPAFQP